MKPHASRAILQRSNNSLLEGVKIAKLLNEFESSLRVAKVAESTMEKSE